MEFTKILKCDNCHKRIFNKRHLNTFDNEHFEGGEIHATFCSRDCKLEWIAQLREKQQNIDKIDDKRHEIVFKEASV